MRFEPWALGMISVKVSAANLPATLKAISSTWGQLIPNRPFEYNFLDEFFDRQYRAEDHFGNLFFNFAVLAIFISCLGLLGLSSYSTMQRTKEIGIRKVLGANVTGIVFAGEDGSVSARLVLIAIFATLVALVAVSLSTAERSARVSGALVRLMDTTAQIRVRGAWLLLVAMAALAGELGLELILGAFAAGAMLAIVDRDDAMTHLPCTRSSRRPATGSSSRRSSSSAACASTSAR